MPKKTEIPDALRAYVEDLGSPVTSTDVDTYSKLSETLDRSHRIRTIVNAWRAQQSQDRAMRRKYATWLIVAMGVQAIIINAVFFLIGYEVLKVDPWTARSFILAVFGELAAMVYFIVKYLFRPASETVLQLAGGKGESKPRRPKNVD